MRFRGICVFVVGIEYEKIKLLTIGVFVLILVSEFSNKSKLEILIKSANQGDVEAQYNLGLMYENGQGVLQDYKEAIKWYKKSAEQGDKHAQSNLGRMYRYGWGVSRDYKETVRWYRLATEQGLAKA
jgi:hypothetical protein